MPLMMLAEVDRRAVATTGSHRKVESA